MTTRVSGGKIECLTLFENRKILQIFTVKWEKTWKLESVIPCTRGKLCLS